MIATLKAAAASAAPTAMSAAGGANGAGEFVRVVLSLAAVVAMILVVGWLTRRMQSRVRPGGQRIRCVETLAVGMKERVLLLEVGERQLVVGASPAGLRTLLVLDEKLPAPAASPIAPIAGINFRDVMARWRKPQ